jgi:2-amino-4-hydroxy-6-hydroxymethyldihydropteridine diphosphokinase
MALHALRASGIRPVSISGLYASKPIGLSPNSAVPRSDSNFVNAVLVARSALPPRQLLRQLHVLENRFGRQRKTLRRFIPRPLDLDLIACGDERIGDPQESVATPAPPLVLPHPRLADRPFILKPLQEILPDWRHPVSGVTVAEMLMRLPPGLRASSWKLTRRLL